MKRAITPRKATQAKCPEHSGGSTSEATARTDPPCIDLEQQFGHRFRVEYGPSYYAQYGERARVNDPWLKIIPCRNGHIYPHGGKLLAASTNNRGPVAKRLMALPCTTVWQDGDDGVTVLFDVADFDKVAALMHPRRRRTATPRMRAHLERIGRKTRFRHGVGSRGASPESTEISLDGQ